MFNLKLHHTMFISRQPNQRDIHITMVWRKKVRTKLQSFWCWTMRDIIHYGTKQGCIVSQFPFDNKRTGKLSYEEMRHDEGVIFKVMHTFHQYLSDSPRCTMFKLMEARSYCTSPMLNLRTRCFTLRDPSCVRSKQELSNIPTCLWCQIHPKLEQRSVL